MAARRSAALQAALAQVAPGTPLREGLDRIVKAKMGALVVVCHGRDVLNRANQAVQTLERYKSRLDDVSSALSSLEVEDLVTLRDVASVLQRNEMVRRIAEEIDGYIVQLGADARLIRLQLDELMGDVE